MVIPSLRGIYPELQELRVARNSLQVRYVMILSTSSEWRNNVKAMDEEIIQQLSHSKLQ